MMARDPLCKAQELATKAEAATEMIRLAADGLDEISDHFGEALWSLKDQIAEIYALICEAHKNRRTEQ